MAGSSFGISGVGRLSPLSVSRPAAEQPYRSHGRLRRRLEDAIEDAFHQALQRGDLAAAEDLLGVLEKVHTRARITFKAERKGTLAMLERARRELATRKARRRVGPG